MKWCVSFPEEEMLIVRPCLTAICYGNKPAAKLLSVLLYRYSIRKESKDDAENINELRASENIEASQDTSLRIYRKQEQLVKDMCGEITGKTLHDVAVPVLQLLGYLDIDESSYIHCYELHLDMVVQALELYKKGDKQLEKFIQTNFQQQLEKFLIEAELEKFLINKNYFSLQLEKVLIVNRNNSNCKRGRKPAPEKAASTKNKKPQIIRENIESNNKKTTYDAAASQTPQNASPKKSSPPKKPATKKIVPPTQAELRHINEPNLSALNDQEKKTYATLRQEDQVVYLSWRPTQRNVYNNWLGVFGYAVPVDITVAVIRDVNRFEPIQPTTADFLDIRKRAYAQDKTKPVDKQYYKNRGFKIWDAMREYAGWKSQLDMICQEESANSSKSTNQPSSQMDYSEACNVAQDAIAKGKQHGYVIDAKTYSSGSGWLVNIVWDGQTMEPIESRKMWNEQFSENHQFEQELKQQERRKAK
jgi:hypothetical protein